MWGGERESITGVWGRSPQRGPGAESLDSESQGVKPPEAENLSAFGCPTEAANLPHCPYKPQIFVIHLSKTEVIVHDGWTILCINRKPVCNCTACDVRSSITK